MGVDCKIEMFPATRLNEVADALGLMLGCELTRNDSGFRVVNGVATGSCCVGLEACATIDIDSPTYGHRQFIYHFEGSRGERTILMASKAVNIALMVGLARTFGGFVDFDDSDDESCDFGQPPFAHLGAEDDKPWYALQARIDALGPLTATEIGRYEDAAAYKSH